MPQLSVGSGGWGRCGRLSAHPGACWWLGLVLHRPSPESSDEARRALLQHLLLCLCCSLVSSLPVLLRQTPSPVLFHSCSAAGGGGLVTALCVGHCDHVWTHCLPCVSSNQPSPFVLFFFLFSNTPGPDSLQKSELQPYSVQVWFQGQY